MADVRHSTLSGADLHNPKQHALESDTLHSNGGSAGEVLVSNGDTTASWTDPNLIGSGAVYAESYIFNNAVATVIGGANTYQKVGTSITWVSGHSDNVVWATDHFVVQISGDYKLSCTLSIIGGGVKVYNFAFGVDTGSGITILEHGVCRLKAANSSDELSGALQAIDPFSAGDLIYLMVRDVTDTTGLTITDVNFTIELKEAA